MSSGERRKLVVLKIGSALVTLNGRKLNAQGLQAWARQISRLQAKGVDVIVVSSGAIAAGMVQMAWSERPSDIPSLQAAAAIGQTKLVQAWQEAFSQYAIFSAQILLDGADLSDRERYLNARAALMRLVGLGVIPVINENDTVVTDEIRFGDNDSLGGLVANLVDADQFIILTDQYGLYTADPRKNPDATLIDTAEATDPLLDEYAGDSKGVLGRGGMQTKLKAARYAARSGTSTFIGKGDEADIIELAEQGLAKGTYLTAKLGKFDARKRWLAGLSHIRGSVVVDSGAGRALLKKGASLLSIGVVSVEGDFQRGDLVTVKSVSGANIAKGLVNYGSADIERIAGCLSSQHVEILGWQAEEEILHRDNLVLLSM